MPSIYLRRLIIEINKHIEHLFIYTQDYQWSFDGTEGFSSDFFDLLHDLQTFEFYIRLITTDNLRIFLTDIKYLINRNLCNNIGYILSKDIGQIFSLPFAFNHFEIFEKNFFNQINFFKYEKLDNYWNNIQYLTLHINIYDSLLLKLIKEKFIKLRSIDYQVPHFSLIPQDNELHQYNIKLSKFNRKSISKILIVYFL